MGRTRPTCAAREQGSSESSSLAATALLPFVLLPLTGIMGARIAKAYVNSTIFLFLGGFLIALAIERWELHRRMALTIIQVIGTSRARIVLGFMVASAVLSML